MAIFEKLRLSLSVPSIGPLLFSESEREPDITRGDFLKSIFSSQIDFFHGGKLFTYVPSPVNDPKDFRLSGYIGKQVEMEFQSGPNSFFAVTREKHWKAAFVTIDISSDSQLMFFEKRHDVGKAQAILFSLISEFIKSFKGFSWHIDIEYLTIEESFWSAVNQHRGEITEVIFEFVPPNVLKGYDRVKELDRLITQESNSDSSAYSLKNKEGALDPKGDFVEGAVKYSSEGAGAIKLKNGRKTIFNSKESRQTSDAAEELMPRGGEPTKILGLIEHLFKKKK